MQPVQSQPVYVHPTPPVLYTEYRPEPGGPWRLPKYTSSRQRSEPKAFGAYGCRPPQSKPKDNSRTYGQHRTRPEQSLYPKKAIEYQDQEQEADERVFTGPESSSDTLDENRTETKESTRSQQVDTKRESSKLGRVQKWVESQPDAADKQVKVNSANPAGTERKHTTKQPTRAPHPQTDSKRRPEKPVEQAKERTSTNTAGTGRAYTTAQSSGNKFSIRPGESQSGPNITINQHEGSSLKFKYDPKRWEFGISTPVEKSTGHRRKEKPKESSRGSRSSKLTKEDVPDYYAIIGCPMDTTTQTISSKIKKKQLEVHPDKQAKSFIRAALLI